ncbi:MAG: hypothetical protein ACRCTZ_16055 [Sarcina sp.]
MKIRTVLIMLVLSLATVIEWNTKGTNFSCILTMLYIGMYGALNFKKLNRMI